jgi:hypothetical protein
MAKTVLLCGRIFDGLSDALKGPAEILVENGVVADIAQAVGRPTSASVIDLLDRTIMPDLSMLMFISVSTASTSATGFFNVPPPRR